MAQVEVYYFKDNVCYQDQSMYKGACIYSDGSGIPAGYQTSLTTTTATECKTKCQQKGFDCTAYQVDGNNCVHFSVPVMHEWVFASDNTY